MVSLRSRRGGLAIRFILCARPRVLVARGCVFVVVQLTISTRLMCSASIS